MSRLNREKASALLPWNLPHTYTRVECVDCGWHNEGRDRKSVVHSGWVHTEILRPGHRVTGNPEGNAV